MLMSVKFGSIALYIGARVRNAYKTYQKLKAYEQYQRTARNIAGRARNNAVSKDSLLLSFHVYDFHVTFVGVTYDI